MLINGLVTAVLDRGEGDKRWAIVVVDEKTIDFQGAPVTTTHKCKAFGRAIKEGFHNAYRRYENSGALVYVPVSVSVDDRNAKELDLVLSGPPVELMEKPLGTAQPKPTAPAQPQAAQLPKAAAQSS